MKAMEYLDEETVILSLRSQYGNLELTAKELGCSRGQLQDYIVSHPEVREEKHQIKEALKDEAEQQLAVRMKESDSLLRFFLETQAKDRGYGSNSNVTMSGPNGGPIDVKVNARALIAAMRNGFEEDEVEEEVVEDYEHGNRENGKIQQLPDLRPDEN